MNQRVNLLFLLLAATAAPRMANAEEPPSTPPAEETFTVEETESTAAPAEPAEESAPTESKSKTTKDRAKLGEERVSWQDIVVVIRKPFLKMNRIEILPSWGITVNDNMIQHQMFDGQVNYYLTDVLAVGVEGQAFFERKLETYDLVALQDRRLPTLNKYNYGAALNFHYVPIYGKFAMFSTRIVHWEALFTAGVGFTQSEVIPRDPKLPGWTNFLITPNVGLSFRVFLSRWITLNLGVRDFILSAQYEPVDRPEDLPLAKAMDKASSALVNHIMFQAGLSLWFPMTFQYTTFR